jgi:DNA-directed RNA polymerase subunit RPC12/RpoP
MMDLEDDEYVCPVCGGRMIYDIMLDMYRCLDCGHVQDERPPRAD